MKSNPSCAKTFSWLQGNLGKNSLGALTGTDVRALYAAVQTIELYSYNREQSVLEAFAKIVRCMQPSTREFAFHAIAQVMDWSDRSWVWKKSGLESFETPIRKCVGEG